MKKSWKLILMTAIFVLTAWLSGERPAQATLSCENYADKPCSRLGARFGCNWADGHRGICFCDCCYWECQ